MFKLIKKSFQFVGFTQQLNYGVSMSSIKQLRELTGSAINDCQKALQNSNGDIDGAKQYLRERGLIQAQKRENKEVREGVIGILKNKDGWVVAVEVNCETDFVARTGEFLQFTNNILNYYLENPQQISLNNQDEWQSFQKQPIYSELFGSGSINEARQLLIAKLQENVVISSLNILQSKTNGVFGTYLHNVYGDYPIGMQGSIVELQLNTDKIDKVQQQILDEGATNLAICLLGMKAKYINRSHLPEQIINEQREQIIKTIPDDKKTNPKTMEFIIQGRLKKFYQDNVFEDMEYILDDTQEISISQYIKGLENLMGLKQAKITIGKTLTLSIKQ